MDTWKRLAQTTTLQFVARTDCDSGWDGAGSGKVDVAQPDTNTIVFTESGTWDSATGQQLNFKNVYRWSLIETDKLIRLEHLRFGPSNPLYLFDLERHIDNSWQSVSPHICRDDLYIATMVLTPDQIQLRWRITGPAKNETIQYTYQ